MSYPCNTLPPVQFQRLTGLQQFFVPFQRSSASLDDDERIVEGLAYTSGRVRSDRWNLPYATLKRALPAYMEIPAIRSMHRPDIAAGLALEATPLEDRKAVFVRARIVDDQEWRKCKAGVYRGFSLGGKPVLVRGDDIAEFELLEISLVDRPADSGARFTLVRSESVTDADELEYAVGILPEGFPINVARLLTEKKNILADLKGGGVTSSERLKRACRLARIDMELVSYGVTT